MKRIGQILLALVLLSFTIPCSAEVMMPITSGGQGAVQIFNTTNWIESFMGISLKIDLLGVNSIDTRDWGGAGSTEILMVYPDHCTFYNFYGLNEPDPYGRDIILNGILYYDSKNYWGRNDPPYYWPSASGLIIRSIEMDLLVKNWGTDEVSYDSHLIATTPVPEPFVDCLFVAGFFGLLGFRKWMPCKMLSGRCSKVELGDSSKSNL